MWGKFRYHQYFLKFLVFFNFLISLLVFGVVAQGIYADEPPSRIVLSLSSDPKTFNPVVSKEATTSTVLSLTFEGLTQVDGVTTEVGPHLAEEWQVSKDGLEWEFKLREDVLWSDGEKFTAGDVVFTFNQLIYNPDVDTSTRDIVLIDDQPFKVEASGPFKVKITLPKPFAPFLLLLAGVEILPEHLLKEVVTKKEFNSHWGVFTDLKSVVGTGPYLLKEYQSGQNIILEKNPNYWRKTKDGKALPQIDKIIYLIVPNNDISLLKFQQGDLDVYSMRGSDYPILKPVENKDNFIIYDTGPQFGTNFIIFNQNNRLNSQGKSYVSDKKRSWFNNVKFRQAIAYAIDREAIIDILMYGFGIPQYGPISPAATFFYTPDIISYPYDLKKAKILLKEAGFKWKNNKLLDSSGNPVQIVLMTNSDNTVRVKMAELIKKDISRLGIDIKFVSLEFNNLVNKLNVTFDWDAIMIGLTGGIDPHFGRNVWHSTGRMHLWNPKQTKPATEWEARIDEIFDSAVAEMNPQKRKILYDEFQKIISEQVPVIYTVLSERIVAVRNKFGGLKPAPYGGVLHNLEEWYLKKDKSEKLEVKSNE